MSFCFRGNKTWLIDHPLAGPSGFYDGAALIPGPMRPLTVIFSSGEGWEHVSVSTPGRCPNWDEMCVVKEYFWDAEDAVMQLHPPRSTYVNVHPNCLHLWRPTKTAIPLPPDYMV